MRCLRVTKIGQPTKYYLDGRRVSKDAYDYHQILANIRNWQRDTFYTICKKSGTYHYSHIRSRTKVDRELQAEEQS